MNKLAKQNTGKELLIPFILTFVAAALMLSCIFLPYATATPSYAEKIDRYPNEQVFTGSELTAKDIKNVSMVEYAYLYTALSEHFSGNSLVCGICVAMVGLIGGFSLLAALFALGKKPIPVIVFTLLAFGVFALQNYDYTDRGVIPSDSYTWGLAHTLFPIAAVIVLASAVWMLVTKLLLKKQRQSETDVPPES